MDRIKIIEITGISGVGKSSYLNFNINHYTETIFKIRGSIKNKKQKLKLELILWFYLFKKRPINSNQMKWIIKKSFQIDESLLMKFNVLRNCLLKFSHYPLIRDKEFSKSIEVIYIDEGISHIPFILQDKYNNKISSEFCYLFAERLKDINVLCIESDRESIPFDLLIRGHRRLKTEEDAIQFVELNKLTLQEIKNNKRFFKEFNTINTNAKNI